MSTLAPIDVRVHSMTMASDTAILIELRPLAPSDELPAFDAGSHIDVHVGPLIRQYSLLNNPREQHRYLIAVLRERVSRGGSKAIHEQLHVGQILTISAPRNNFTVGKPEHAVLVAAGIGITPLLSMAEWLYDEGIAFELHHYGESGSLIPLQEHIKDKAFADCVTTHLASEGQDFRNATELPASYMPGSQVFTCGPAPFMDRVIELAQQGGWLPEDIHLERFVPTEPVDTSGEEFTVIVSSTKEEIAVGKNQTIADALQNAGYEVVLSCEQGMCGSCLTPVVEGIPDHRDEVQSETEHACNQFINVCCSRSKTPTLTLDA